MSMTSHMMQDDTVWPQTVPGSLPGAWHGPRLFVATRVFCRQMFTMQLLAILSTKKHLRDFPTILPLVHLDCGRSLAQVWLKLRISLHPSWLALTVAGAGSAVR